MRWKLQAFAAAIVLLCVEVTPVRAEAMRVTGYTCPPYCGGTSDGTPVSEGVAACPSSWAFGTQVLIHFPDGDVVATCHDHYSAVLSPRIDLFWWSLADCYSHTGVFDVEVVRQ